MPYDRPVQRCRKPRKPEIKIHSAGSGGGSGNSREAGSGRYLFPCFAVVGAVPNHLHN